MYNHSPAQIATPITPNTTHSLGSAPLTTPSITPSALKLHTFRISETTYLAWTMATLHLSNASHHIRLHLAEFLALPSHAQLNFILSNPRPKTQLYPFALYLPLQTASNLSSQAANLLPNNPSHPLTKLKPNLRVSLNLLVEAALQFALQTHYPTHTETQTTPLCAPSQTPCLM